jgi:predicted amidophosphoribosyltransferase
MAHAGPARELVHALKFRGAVAAADVMAAPLAALAPAWSRDEDAVLVPVPADPGRRRGRGVDHAGLLTAALGRRAGVRVVPCLAQPHTVRRQVGAPRAARLASGGPEVSVRGRAPVRAVLVDDVHTTGATLVRAARALVGAGTADVRVLTYARTL